MFSKCRDRKMLEFRMMAMAYKLARSLVKSMLKRGPTQEARNRLTVKNICNLHVHTVHDGVILHAKAVMSSLMQKINQTWQFNLRTCEYLDAMHRICSTWRKRNLSHRMKLLHLRLLFDREKKVMMQACHKRAK